MHAFAGQGVEINGKGGDQGFAFAGTHLGDFAVVQHHTADKLYVEVAHTEYAAGCFAANGKGFDQNVVQSLSVGEALFEFGGFSLEGFVAQRLHFGFKRVDFGDGFTILFQQTVVAAAEDFLSNVCKHEYWFLRLI